MSFKTGFAGHTHRHVVLGVFYDGKYGALGMSRRHSLMYKPLQFKVSLKAFYAKSPAEYIRPARMHAITDLVFQLFRISRI